MEKCTSAIVDMMLAGALVALAGCGGAAATGKPQLVDYDKVRNMTAFYEGYVSEHKNQPPANEQAFREYLNTKQDSLQKAKLTVDEFFKSPRGDTSLQWVYGKSRPRGRGGITYLAYEKEPIDGKRIVFGTRGMCDELDNNQFKTAFPNLQ